MALAPSHMIGATTRIAVAPKNMTAPRQPKALARLCATGKLTVPANPATRVTNIIERLACAPRARVINAKQGSYRLPDMQTPIRPQIR